MCHFEMLIEDMLDEQEKIQYGNSFFHKGIICVLIVVKSHMPPS